MNTTTAISVMATVTIRLPNSIQVWNIGSPAECAATRLPRVHCGQSGQPRPDSLSRTAAPVAMIPAAQITPARAMARMAAGEGIQHRPHARGRRERRGLPVRGCAVLGLLGRHGPHAIGWGGGVRDWLGQGGVMD